MLPSAKSRVGSNSGSMVPDGNRSERRRVLPEPQVRSILVVVAHVVGKKTPEMIFLQHDHRIEPVPTTAFDPSLRDTILPGTLERRPLGRAAHGFHRGDDLGTEFQLAVEDRVLVERFAWAGVIHECGRRLYA
jgi:hypothetical protein